MSESHSFYPEHPRCKKCAGGVLITRRMLEEEIDRQSREWKELQLAAYDQGMKKYQTAPCINACGREPWPVERRKETVDRRNYDAFENIRIRCGGDPW